MVCIDHNFLLKKTLINLTLHLSYYPYQIILQLQQNPKSNLNQLTPLTHNQEEYYLTDIFDFINSNNVSMYTTEDINEINGINTIQQLGQIKNQLGS